MVVRISLMCWLADLRGHVTAVRITCTYIYSLKNCVTILELDEYLTWVRIGVVISAEGKTVNNSRKKQDNS
jgi:hypothetical protein